MGLTAVLCCWNQERSGKSYASALAQLFRTIFSERNEINFTTFLPSFSWDCFIVCKCSVHSCAQPRQLRPWYDSPRQHPVFLHVNTRCVNQGPTANFLCMNKMTRTTPIEVKPCACEIQMPACHLWHSIPACPAIHLRSSSPALNPTYKNHRKQQSTVVGCVCPESKLFIS